MRFTCAEMPANLCCQFRSGEPSKERAGRDPPAEHPSVSPSGDDYLEVWVNKTARYFLRRVANNCGQVAPQKETDTCEPVGTKSPG